MKKKLNFYFDFLKKNFLKEKLIHWLKSILIKIILEWLRSLLMEYQIIQIFLDFMKMKQ